MHKLKKFVLFATILIMVVSISGCNYIDNSLNGENRVPRFFNNEPPTIQSIIVNKETLPGWFKRNPIQVTFYYNFPEEIMNIMIESLEYLESLDAGLKFDTFISPGSPPSMEIMQQQKFTGIHIVNDTEHSKTWPSKYETSWFGLRKELIKPAVLGRASINQPGRFADEGIENARPYNISSNYKDIPIDDNRIDLNSAEVYENLSKYKISDSSVEDYFNFSSLDYLDQINSKLSSTVYELYGGNVWILPEHTNYTNTQTLFIHEILHILGFGHIYDPNSIMYPKGDKNSPTELSPQEKKMLEELYPSGNPEYKTSIYTNG